MMKKTRLLLLVLPVIAGAVYLRSLASWRPKKVFALSGQVSALVFSNNGHTLLVAHAPVGSSPDELLPTTLTGLDTPNGFKNLWQRKNELNFERPPQFFADDSQLLVHGWKIQILDAKTGKTRKDYGRLLGRSVMSPDGKWLAYNGFNLDDAATLDGRIFLNPAPEESQTQRRGVAQKVIGKQSDRSFDLAFSPDGKRLAVGVGDRNGAHLDFYDVKTWKHTGTWRDLKRTSAEDFPFYEKVQWSTNKRFLLSSWFQIGGGTGVSLWRVSDGKKLASYTGMSNPLRSSLALQDDGRVLSWWPSSQVFLSKADSLNWKFQELLSLPGETITTAALSPDGTYLVAGTRSGRVYQQRVR